MKIENIINNNGNRAANQFVIKHGDKVYFQSYESVVALWDKGEGRLTVTPRWDFSVTTRKHFYIFLNDYTRYSGKRDEVLNGIKDGSIVVVKHGDLDF